MTPFARRAAAAAALSLALLTGVRVRAQYVPPRIEVVRLPGAARRSALEPQDVAFGDCVALHARQDSLRFEELADVRVTVYAPWYVSAGRLAADKAGELGANCLMKRSEWGLGSYPYRVSYHAYRVSRQSGFGTLARWWPLRKTELAASLHSTTQHVPPSGAQEPSRRTPATQAADIPLWTSGNFIFRYEIGMDTAKLPVAVWQDAAQDFKEFFPPAQYARFLRAHREGRKILIDFKRLRITVVP